MKIRTGFVSNSSSSSFCIVGVIANKTNFSIPETEGILDFLEGQINLYENNLTVKYGIDNYCDNILVGTPITEIDENKTIAEFKKEIFDNLKKVGFKGNLADVKICIDGGVVY